VRAANTGSLLTRLKAGETAGVILNVCASIRGTGVGSGKMDDKCDVCDSFKKVMLVSLDPGDEPWSWLDDPITVTEARAVIKQFGLYPSGSVKVAKVWCGECGVLYNGDMIDG